MSALVLLAVTAALALVALAALTRTQTVQRWDDAVESFADRYRAATRPFAAVGTLPGEPYAHWLIGAATAAALLVLRPGALLRFIAPLALASLGAILLHHAVKFAYRRPRPTIALNRGKTEAAFPSGHTTDATAALLVSAYLLSSQNMVAPAVAANIAALLSVLTGLSRVALGWHWASDVVGGWLAGVAVAALCAELYARLAG